MSIVNVGIGDYVISSNAGEHVKTYGLGSCVAVVIYDQSMKIAAMMHIALPESSVNVKKAESKPGYFVDTGLPLLLAEVRSRTNGRGSPWVKLAGGSNIMDEKQRFDIGKRNVLAIKKLLWKYRLGVIAEDVGGGISRTVSMSVDTGEVLLSSGPDQWTI